MWPLLVSPSSPLVQDQSGCWRTRGSSGNLRSTTVSLQLESLMSLWVSSEGVVKHPTSCDCSCTLIHKLTLHFRAVVKMRLSCVRGMGWHILWTREETWSDTSLKKTCLHFVPVTRVSMLSTLHTYRGLWELVAVQLSWLSGRAPAAQARGVLGPTPGNQPFHFPLCLPHNI